MRLLPVMKQVLEMKLLKRLETFGVKRVWRSSRGRNALIVRQVYQKGTNRCSGEKPKAQVRNFMNLVD